MSTTPSDNGKLLSSEHRSLLETSGISAAVAESRGYFTEAVKERLQELGYSRSQRVVPALVIPIYGMDGAKKITQIRPDEPRVVKGKTCRYEWPHRSRQVIDVPPNVNEKVRAGDCRLFITVGIRQADALVSQGEACLGLPTAGAWKGQDEFWSNVPLDEREVIIVFSSRLTTNAHLQRKAVGLKGALAAFGANARIVPVPAGETGRKVGVDDYLACGGSVRQLLASPPFLVGEDDLQPEGQPSYRMNEDGIWLERIDKDDEVYRQRLTNFQARIIEEITVTDGMDEEKEFRLEVNLGGQIKTFTVGPEDLQTTNWPLRHVGARAMVFPGYGVADHVRTAIQRFSSDLTLTTVCHHLGWAIYQGRRVFVHAGGVIDPQQEGAASQTIDPPIVGGNPATGPMGPQINGDTQTQSIAVRAPADLDRFRLPTPPSEDDLPLAIRRSMRFLCLGPQAVFYPLFAAVFRPTLGRPDYAVNLVGPTGSQKSSVAAVGQQYFGSEMDADHLPGNWGSTANSNAALLFGAKDVLVVVDDWVPQGSRSDILRAHREFDRVVRAQADGAGRGRCSGSGQRRPTRSPRGLILCTGELPPDGVSLNARILMLELDRGDVDLKMLQRCQNEAAAGLYASVMADYLTWLAPRYDRVRTEMQQQCELFRDNVIGTCRHARTAAIAADVLAGFEVFLDYARERGAINDDAFAHLWKTQEDALAAFIERQNLTMLEADPVERFLNLLYAVLRCGRAYVRHPDSGSPEYEPERWGWEKRTKLVPAKPDPNDSAEVEEAVEVDWVELDTWRSRGQHIGWISSDYLYLQVETTLAVVQRLAQEVGPALPFSERTLGRELFDRGILALADRKRGKYTTRESFAGERETYLCLYAEPVMAKRRPTANELLELLA